MPNALTNADSLRAYNTGAASAGAVQADPALSLGGYRSSSFVKQLRYKPVGVPNNIQIVFVSGSNGEGTGTLTCASTTVSWTAPGSSTAGIAVAIANGETKIVEDGEDVSKYVRIAKTTTAASTGVGTVTLTDNPNNAVAMGNITAADALAGDLKYRSIGLHNGSALSVTGIKVYAGAIQPAVGTYHQQLPATGAGEIWSAEFVGGFPDAGYFAIYEEDGTLREVVHAIRSTFGYAVAVGGRGRCGTTASQGADTDTFAPVHGVELAIEEPVADAITASVNEDTAPVGITYTPAFSEATAVTTATLTAGSWIGLHIKRDTAPASGAIPLQQINLTIKFTYNGVEYTKVLTGGYRVANAVRWDVWISETASIDFEATPDDTAAALPLYVPLAAPVGSKPYWYAVRYTNKYGLTSLNRYLRRFVIEDDPDYPGTPIEGTPLPTSPYDVSLVNSLDGDVYVYAKYNQGADEGFEADYIYVYAAVGANPVPGSLTFAGHAGVPEITDGDGGATTRVEIGPYAAGADLRVIVRAYRSDDGLTDGNTTVYTFTTASAATAPEDVTAL